MRESARSTVRTVQTNVFKCRCLYGEIRRTARENGDKDEDETMRARQLFLDFSPICRVYYWTFHSGDRDCILSLPTRENVKTTSVRLEIKGGS